MKLTIIIPVYGVEDYIADCIRSVVNQDYNDLFECIIVDDKTPDRSIEIASEIISTYEGNIEFRLIRHEKNMGLSSARNTGIEAARGDYIYFLDSDDEITSNCVSLFMKQIEKEQYDMIVSDYKLLNSTLELPHVYMKNAQVCRNDEVIAAYYHKLWYPMAVAKFYKLSTIKNEGLKFKEGLMHEDELWSAETACVIKSVYILQEQTYLYKYRSGSIMTSQVAEKHNKALRQIYLDFQSFVNSKGLKNNYWVNSICQNLVYMYLSDTKKSFPNSFTDNYSCIHLNNRMSICKLISINKFWMGSMARDFHYVIGVDVGRKLYQLFNLRFYNKRYHNFLRRILNRVFYHGVYM